MPTQTFTAGTHQSFVVPPGIIEVQAEVYGGGTSATPTSGLGQPVTMPGGPDALKGHKVVGTYTTTPAETLDVNVGTYVSGVNASSDVRQGGTAVANRIIVAGAGGYLGTASLSPVQTFIDNNPTQVPTVGGAASGATPGAAGTSATFSNATDTDGSAGAVPGSGGIGGAGASEAARTSGGRTARATGGNGGSGYAGGGGGAALAKVVNTGTGNYAAYGMPGGHGSNFLGSGTSTSESNYSRVGHGLVILRWGADVNHAPNQPNILFPASGNVVDPTAAFDVRWTFTDQDVGDTQSRWTLQIREQGTVTPLLVDEDQSDADQAFTVAGGTLDLDKEYELQMQVWDSTATPSAATSWTPFSTSAPNGPPTITEPDPGDTITTGISDVTWLPEDGQQDAFEIQRIRDGSVVYSTGVIGDAAARSYPVPFSTNSVTESVRVAVRYGPYWSSAQNEVDVAWTPPATPTITVDDTTLSGAVRITVDNSNPGGGTPDTTSNDIYVRSVTSRIDPLRPVGGDGIRIATLVPVDGIYDDYAVAAGCEYEYRVEAVTATGAIATTDWEA